MHGAYTLVPLVSNGIDSVQQSFFLLQEFAQKQPNRFSSLLGFQLLSSCCPVTVVAVT